MIAQLKSHFRGRLARRLGVPEIAPAMERLRRQGFVPDLVFDVGAYRGEFAQLCRRVWPRARVACFEPQRGPAALLRGVADENMRVFNTLLGSADNEAVTLYEAETASSVLSEHVDKSHPGVSHPMRSVDSVMSSEFDGRTLDLLKIDVQGYELEVLRGAERTLDGVGAILAEVNLLDIHEGVPLLADVSGWLRERGFVAFDLCGVTRRPLDGALWQVDLVFVPEASRLRSDKRWAA